MLFVIYEFEFVDQNLLVDLMSLDKLENLMDNNKMEHPDHQDQSNLPFEAVLANNTFVLRMLVV
jgi:hypothetical protein